MSAAKNVILFEVFDHLFRSWWTLVAGACIGVSVALISLQYMPKSYEANTKILATPPKIPADMIRSTIQDDMTLRMEALREVMLSRDYMLKLLTATVGLPEKVEAQERRIASLQNRVHVSFSRYTRGGGTQTATLFTLTFRDRNPVLAAKVVNTLAELYIADNLRSRSSRAEETVETFQQLASTVRKEIDARDAAISAFKSQHLYETADQQDANLRLLETRQRDLDSNIKSLSAAQDRLQLLQNQQSASGWTTPSTTQAGVDPYTARLTTLQRELDSLRARYQEAHPEVKAKKRELDDFIAAGNAQTGDKGQPVAPLTTLQIQIRDEEQELARFRVEQQKIRDDIALLNRRLEATPKIQARLDELRKDYDVLQAQYKEYQTKAQAAKGTQHIEETQQGETFEVIDKAVPPTIPVQPQPLMVIVMGLGGGLFVFFAPGLGLRLLHARVGSEAGLRELADVPVLICLPRLETPDTKAATRRGRVKNIGLSMAAVVVLGVVVAYVSTRGA